ncbi:MBOAT family protein [Bacteriovorax stolpii]|uniref:Uncharacterized protein n=2 Tax=Bacteriovorax stolpii TaxID=960 RepID=A0A2K9NX35_BACTC|nr:MBOAT family O-acyltransferase [Bacteriovorax stolpii]AUO00079.1 hypothetical protein C0V70_18600 [Bacteriovorax stolpii]QDK39929.1 MBOAT family protein [Bacteriovorax stolpii]TDP54028.1 alginate O-acetyltransferase complex protein AlgI [Bacteriovorax stolpii]
MAITFANIFFLAVIFVLFYSKKDEVFRIRVLLYGSLLFYFYYEPFLTPLMGVITLVSYLAGNALAAFPKYKKSILWVFLLSLLCLYYPFKYNGTFAIIMNDIFHFKGLRWLYLPLGLSFYSYKTMTYIFDIYYERSLPQKSIEKYVLFISYFPQIFCGPIMGAEEFFKQLKFDQDYHHDNVFHGLRTIIIGLFKKLVLANNLILLIQPAYFTPSQASGLEWILICVLTRFYVYYDFSGYSDISNGVSLLFGIKVKKNFDLPFVSKSIGEFWRRWHISLAAWIRDYVYYPLVSKFSSYAGIYISLIISFVCLGLWHGDHINYILYGFINGVAVAASTYFMKKNRLAPPAPKWKMIMSRFGLYFFLIFMPSFLLLSPDSATFFEIVKAFLKTETWFATDYISGLNILSIVFWVIPLFMIFEYVLVFYGEKLRLRFEEVSKPQRLIWLVFGIFVTFSLLSPQINYRFLYQGF